MKPSLALLLLLVSAHVANAAEGLPMRGVEGLVKVPMTFANAGPQTLACASSIAHWYSLDLGRAVAGAEVAITLWSDPTSGEIFLLNDKQDRMPVQALWCGLEGRSWETRANIALERRAGVAAVAQDRVCRQAEDRVVCEVQPVR